LVKDKSLSVNAQNVKIITRNGKVTLRGPVETEAESMKLQQIAKQTPGVVRVDNQLENIAP
jgi:hyperosmotically inducible protein